VLARIERERNEGSVTAAQSHDLLHVLGRLQVAPPTTPDDRAQMMRMIINCEAIIIGALTSSSRDTPITNHRVSARPSGSS
jgi:hypothetical protein